VAGTWLPPALAAGCCFKPVLSCQPHPLVHHKLLLHHPHQPTLSPSIAPVQKLETKIRTRLLVRALVHLSFFLLHAAGPRRYTHFVTQLSLFRRANVTRLPRILQASRVVAHASYLLSFKPFHTKSAPPAAPKPSRPGRYNARDCDSI
jgi:hypothetical protein